MTHRPVSNDTPLNQLRWRYATKQFDRTRKVSAPDWQTLGQALVLTPSSFGLQPETFDFFAGRAGAVSKTGEDMTPWFDYLDLVDHVSFDGMA